MAYRIAICDDSRKDAEYVLDLLNRWAEERAVPVQAEQFPSAESFLFRYSEDKRFDILLLDIEMGTIAEGVTHEKLVSDESGKYYALWNAQAQYYVEQYETKL